MERFTKKDKFIEYEVVRTSRKKDYYTAAIQDGVVSIIVPEYADNKAIRGFLNQRFLDLYYKIHPEELYFLHYHGKKYFVKCLKSTKDEVTVKEDEIIIKAIKVTSRYYKSVLYKFFAKELTAEIEKLLPQAEEDFKEIKIPKIVVSLSLGVKYLGINRMKKIEISPRIAKYHPKFLKVLLYHEICHSLIRGHKKNFWDLLDSKLPNGSAMDKEMVSIVYNDYLGL